MHKLMRIYNQNRALVIALIGVIALIIIIIQVLNYLAMEERIAKENKFANDKNSSTVEGTTISQGDSSAVTGEAVRNNEASKDTISKFVKCCNEGKVEEAYNMLTDECRERIYPSLEHFKNSYYNKIFYMKRMYSLENWYTGSRFNTYSIKYTEDVLATGNVNSSNNYSDYITVESLENENKINISSYIGALNLNRTKTANGVTVTVKKMHMYMDYTILSISIKNESQNTVCLDTKENVKTTYLYDENGIRYTAFLNENSDEELQIRRGMEKTINIKFNKRYNPESREIYRSKI